MFNNELEDDKIELCLSEYKAKTRKASANFNKSMMLKRVTSPKAQERSDNASTLKA